jgi:2-iminobutanoate/2-iminopropanoate deaminase
MKTVISTAEAPSAVGPYSQGIAAGPFVFCSGQIPLEPETGALVQGDISTQVKRVLQNIAAVLRAHGLGMEHVVKTTVFLTNMADFAEMNTVYAEYFLSNPPARSTIQVAALPKGANVEIEAIASKPT